MLPPIARSVQEVADQIEEQITGRELPFHRFFTVHEQGYRSLALFGVDCSPEFCALGQRHGPEF